MKGIHLWIVVLCTCSAYAEHHDSDQIFKASGIRRGLFVIQDDEAGLALDLADEEPVLVLLLAPR